MYENFSCGERIRQLRAERALSQERLALTAGITPAYLGLVERGKRNATVVIIERLCHAMGISLSEFFTTDEPSGQSQNPIGNQILYQLSELKESEMLAVLQLIKDIVQIRQLAIQNNTPTKK